MVDSRAKALHSCLISDGGLDCNRPASRFRGNDVVEGGNDGARDRE